MSCFLPCPLVLPGLCFNLLSDPLHLVTIFYPLRLPNLWAASLAIAPQNQDTASLLVRSRLWWSWNPPFILENTLLPRNIPRQWSSAGMSENHDTLLGDLQSKQSNLAIPWNCEMMEAFVGIVQETTLPLKMKFRENSSDRSHRTGRGFFNSKAAAWALCVGVLLTPAEPC